MRGQFCVSVPVTLSRLLLALTLALLVACAGPTSPGDVSGLVRLGSGELLAVHDTKVGKSSDRTPRVSFADSKHESLRGVAVDWPKGQMPASDLEAACKIPGTGDVLLLESGYYKGKYGRIFRGVPTIKEGSVTRIKITQYWLWPEGTTDIEGGWCFMSGDQTMLLVANRDGKLSTAPLDLRTDASGSVLVLSPFQISLPEFPELQRASLRPVSDLLVDRKGIVWAAATQDPGERGPYRSIIYSLGSFHPTARRPMRASASVRRTVVDGLKVEGLSEGERDSTLFFATDDENFGGVVRPIEKP